MKRVTIDPRYHDAVIFDLDRFVADITALHAAAWKRTLDRFQTSPSSSTMRWAPSSRSWLPLRRCTIRPRCSASGRRARPCRIYRTSRCSTLAYDVYIHRLRKYIGAYLALLGTADVITLTAGVG
jgi:hypothetical protein